MLRFHITFLSALLFMASLSSCAQYNNNRGVEVSWQPSALADLKRGESTRSEVLAALGPPSQIISLEQGSVFYYLYERSRGKGFILVLYNRGEIDTLYDRAVFFFDENNILTDFASHIANE
jgi:outer membrane protein assembly factor BamE (lipoprotein component of BamABCDE complex)